jgi:hypothetical protein
MEGCTKAALKGRTRRACPRRIQSTTRRRGELAPNNLHSLFDNLEGILPVNYFEGNAETERTALPLDRVTQYHSIVQVNNLLRKDEAEATTLPLL